MCELVKRYRPSNSDEGFSFESKWCATCERDRVANGSVPQADALDSDLCDVLNRAMGLGIDEPGYPDEWTYRDGVPVCTGWVEQGRPVPVPRCDHTTDLFDG